MSLSDKQDYFKYGTEKWSYKQPPSLDDSLVQGMKREGFDKNYRVIWGGVAIYRTEAETLTGEIRGDRRATRINEDNQRLQPSYLFGRARQPVKEWCCYSDDDGHKVRTTVENLVPPGKFIRWEMDFQYVEYGILNWFLEYLYEGEWHCLKRLETPEGLYYEPDVRTLEMIRKREYENENEDLNEVAERERLIMAKISQERAAIEERKKRAMIDAMVADQLRRAEARRVYSLN